MYLSYSEKEKHLHYFFASNYFTGLVHYYCFRVHSLGFHHYKVIPAVALKVFVVLTYSIAVLALFTIE